MKMIYKHIFLVFSLIFSLWPSGALAMVMPGVCLHPLEQAALFQGGSKSDTLEDQIKRAKNNLKDMEKEKQKVQDRIDDNLLENHLKSDEQEPKVRSSDMAKVIVQYIEGQYSELSELSEMELKTTENSEDINKGKQQQPSERFNCSSLV